MSAPTSAAAGSTGRGTSVAHFLAPHWGRIADRLAPVLDREGGENESAPRALVCVPDSGAAVELAAALRAARPQLSRILPVTDALRAARVLKAYGAPIVVATPADAERLLAASALPLDAVQVVALVAADEFDADQLSTVMASVPKDARRVLIAAEATPAVENLLERYFHKAHRLADDASSVTTPAAVQFLLVRGSNAAASVAAVLDDLDPPSAVVVTTDPDGVNEALASHGYPVESTLVQVTNGAAEENVALVIFAGLPSAAAFETAMSGQPARAVALIAPRQLAMLKRLAGSAGVTPFTSRRATSAARAHDERLRGELRAALAASYPAREIIALEPLLTEYDGVELAGAALRLLEAARATAAAAAPAAPTASPTISAERAVRPARSDRSARPSSSDRPSRARDDFPLKDPRERPKPRFEDRTVRRDAPPARRSTGAGTGDRDERAPRRSFGDKPRGTFSDKPRGTFGAKPRSGSGDRPRTSSSDRPRSSSSDKPRGSFGDKPRGSFGDKPRSGFGAKPRGTFTDKPRSTGPRRPRDDR
ncbi:MAG: hypothetical protein AABZ29_09765 [Gemmatimonadota bacterium]